MGGMDARGGWEVRGELAGILAQPVEKAIRKHRKKIWEKQFVQKRIAEIVMDL